MINESAVARVIIDCCPYIRNPKLNNHAQVRLASPINVALGFGRQWPVESYVAETHEEFIEWTLNMLSPDLHSKDGRESWATVIAAMHTASQSRWTYNPAVAEGLLVLGAALRLVKIKVPKIPGDIPLFTISKGN